MNADRLPWLDGVSKPVHRLVSDLRSEQTVRPDPVGRATDMTRALMAIGSGVLLAAGLPAHAAEKPAAGKALVGGYEIVSGEKDGKPEPEERVKGSTVLFTEDTVTVTD